MKKNNLISEVISVNYFFLLGVVIKARKKVATIQIITIENAFMVLLPPLFQYTTK